MEIRDRISYIIVTWNNEGIIEECIDSLLSFDGWFSSEIIVVDNNSTDNTCNVISQKYPHVNLIQLNENIGFSKANNHGLKNATGDYIFFVNPDVIFVEDVITPMVSVLKDNENIGIVCPKLLYKDGSYQVSTCNYPSAKKIFWDDLHFCVLLNHKQKLKLAQSQIRTSENRTVDWAYGAALLVRREDVIKTGGFPECYFMYGEDTEFCMAFKYILNKTTYYLGSSSLIHLGGYSEKQVLNSKKIVYGTQAALYFVKKYYGSRELLKYRILLGISSLVKYCVASVSYCFFRSQNNKNKMIKWKASFLTTIQNGVLDE